MMQSVATEIFPKTLLLRPAPSAVPDDPLLPEPFHFTGRGSEYFRIWIVNLLLTILTLGIYSAWAKVRRTRYFYENTRLAGSGFEYHGNPKAILKGRIIAIILLVAYQASARYSMKAGLVALAILAAVAPWLIWKSMQFKLHNSSYRGIRFRFRGSAGKAYFAFLWMPLLALITFHLMTPFAHQRIKTFQFDESRFGTTEFAFQGSVGSFYKVYLTPFLVYFAGAILLSVVLGFSGAAVFSGGPPKGKAGAIYMATMFLLVLGLWFGVAYALFMSMMQNTVWNNARLGPHRFRSEMKASKTAFILITNLMAIGATFGLFSPFAKIRMMKYRIESVTLIPGENIDNFIADTSREVTAFGEGMADLLDYDFGL